MQTTEKNILKTLAYFDIFHYPISKAEIKLFHPGVSQSIAIDASLDFLCNQEIIFKLEEFYSLHNDPTLVERRHKGNQLAMAQMNTARKASAILSRFPYVKGLAISGSLSKNYADEKTDIDFFIITTANRLWIARTLLHLFYKLNFFTGRQNWYCLNYYVDEAGPEIVEKNIFTAIELVTLLPMHGKYTLEQFMKANTWKNNFFPLCDPDTRTAIDIKKGIFSRLVERLLNGSAGDRLDNWLMHLTDIRWRKKLAHNRRNSKGVAIGMLVDKHFAKPYPGFFQDKIISMYQTKLDVLEQFQPTLSKVSVD